MVKKLLLTVVFLFFILTFMAQEKSNDSPGIMLFQGTLDKEQYILSLHFEQNQVELKEIKAIKVTYEPSGTVAALIYSDDSTEEDIQFFLEGKEALSLLKTDSFLVLNPIIYYYPQAKYLAEEEAIKIEYYLADEDGDYELVNGGEFYLDILPSFQVDQTLQEY